MEICRLVLQEVRFIGWNVIEVENLMQDIKLWTCQLQSKYTLSNRHCRYFWLNVFWH